MTLTVADLGEVAVALDAEIDPELVATWRPRYNVAPSQPHLILRVVAAGRSAIVPADWGLVMSVPRERGSDLVINARAESVRRRPAFRDAFRRRRCVVPADGFYEWRGARGEREPVWFHAPDRSLLLFAGLFEERVHPETGEVRPAFTVVTTQARGVVAEVHDRMPLILSRGALGRWLAGPRPEALLAPSSAPLAVRAASHRVNSADNDDAGCLEPEAPKQLRLF